MEKWSFKLSEPLQVSKGGGFEEVYEVIFLAPNYKCRDAAATIEQAILRAAVSMSENDERPEKSDDSENKEINGAAVKFILTQSSSDMKNVYDAFNSIAVNVGTVIDGVPLANNHFQQMSLKDYNGMCYGYIANFIARELLESQK